ncbi:MAG: SMC-Scp complex subunit ScpB [Pseudomonadota bacterium]
MASLKAIIESLLFVSDEPITIRQLTEALGDAAKSRDAISTALLQLEAEYNEGRGVMLKEVAGGYQIRTRPEFREWIGRLKQTSPQKLSRAALEALAIIAYKQPVLKTDVEHLRGVDSGGIFKILLERDLIRILGRKDLPGRPMLYGTTKRFLEVFGLKDLTCLPTLEEMEQLEESWPSGSKSS